MVDIDVEKSDPYSYPSNNVFEFDDKFIEPDSDIRQYGFTREAKQSNLTRREAELVELIGECERLTLLLQKEILREESNIKEPLKDLLDFLKSKKVHKYVVNCAVDGFTAKLSRTHEEKQTINSSDEGLKNSKGKEGFLSKIRP